MTDLVTIGETMLLFQPVEDKPLRYNHFFSRTIGGAESNVAIGVTRLGKTARWIGRLGQDPFGDVVASTIKGENVDTSYIIRDEHYPTGIYFKDMHRLGDPNVYYYRNYSASSRWVPEDIRQEWFQGARHLHMTGITPALGKQTLAFTKEVMKTARELGLTISFDPNIRFKLWSEEMAKKAILSLIPLCDMFMPGLEEAQFLFGRGTAEELSREAMKFGIQAVAMKLGAEGAFGLLQDGTSIYTPGISVDPNRIVDTVGAGDAFAAGFLSVAIDGISGEQLEHALQRGNQAGAFCIQGKGDWENLPYLDELNGLRPKSR